MTTQPRAVVVMGVAGAGKTRLARAISRAAAAAFIEGDDLHPPSNVAKMAAGTPLDDVDRAGWLTSVGAELAAALDAGHCAVASCSALKRQYRDRLRRAVPALSFVYLRISPEAATARVAARGQHFMPSSLVASQFATLEAPIDEDGVLELDATHSPADLLAQVTAWWPVQPAAVAERTANADASSS